MWWKQNRWKIIAPVLIAAVLLFAFLRGGSIPDRNSEPTGMTTAVSPAVTAAHEAATAPEVTAEPEMTAAPETAAEAEMRVAPETAAEPEATAAPEMPTEPEADTETQPEADPETGKDRYQTDPVPEGMPLPVEPQDSVVGETEYSCTISISCASILNNMDLCDPEKKELVPDDGWILEPTAVPFYEGESVFHVLRRVCKQNKIHMEFENTPIYNSAYIEGIHNLYEFDVGELSGWMYAVNGWFPNYGCSRYALQDGDVIEWVYTCDLGFDVGGGYALGETDAE